MAFITTVEGRNLIAAAQQGGNDYNVGYVQFGKAQYTPTGAETALTTPFATPKEFEIAGVVLDDESIHIELTDTNTSDSLGTELYEYNVGEILILDSARNSFMIASRPSCPRMVTFKIASELPNVYSNNDVCEYHYREYHI